MSLLNVYAYGFASTFRIAELERCFSGARVSRGKTFVQAEYATDSASMAFDFGAVVFVNVSGEERARVVAALRLLAPDEPHAPLEEDFLLEVNPTAPPHGEVRFDRVVVPALTPPVIEVVALLLGQSVSIDYYEEDLQEIIAKLDVRTNEMARSGQISGSRLELTRFIGSALSTKNQIIDSLALLDKPQVTWESEPLDRLFRSLHAMLEIGDRWKALDYKLRSIQASLEMVLDLLQTRRMLFLEATIVALIVFEIGLTLLEKVL